MRFNKIDIWAPRWRDKTVLIADYHVKQGLQRIHFTQADLPDMLITAGDIKACPMELITSRSGRGIRMYAVPLSKLKDIKDDQLSIGDAGVNLPRYSQTRVL